MQQLFCLLVAQFNGFVWFCYNFKLSSAGAEAVAVAVVEFLLLNCIELMWYDLICCCSDIYYHFEQLTILFKNNVCDCDYCCAVAAAIAALTRMIIMKMWFIIVLYRIVLYAVAVCWYCCNVFVSTKLYFICLPCSFAHLPLMLRK